MDKIKQFLCGVWTLGRHDPEFIPDSGPGIENEDAHYRCTRCKKYLASAYF